MNIIPLKTSQVDPITLQVIRARLAGIVQEMQNSLFRTGYSTIIRESQDASCAILNCQGNVVAQHVVLPLHMGAFPACARGVLKNYSPSEIHEGDAFITNHPYLGGSPHAPDMAVLTPIFYRGEWVGFAASMAHKSDIGGIVPGSGSGQAREVFQEGLHLPPTKYIARHEKRREIEWIIKANSRTPELVIGDIGGQIGANRVGEKRVSELMQRYGKETVFAATEMLSSYAENRIRQEIASWPDRTMESEGFIDHDGIDLEKLIRIHVRIEKKDGEIHFDFSRCADQTRGPANIRPPLVQACCTYALVCLVDPMLPVNDGLTRAVRTTFREGSVVHPRFPAAVNTYMPTAHVVVETLFKALGELIPEKKIAGGSGSAAMVLGGKHPDSGSFVHYEILTGGTGARRGKDGIAATAFHLSNCKTAPVEIIESEFPTRVNRFELLRDSGGAGTWRGGLGFVREYEILEDEVRFSLRTDKHRVEAWGLEGGKGGRRGSCIINPGSSVERKLPSRLGDFMINKGDLLRLERPGGGGMGDPLERDPQAVLEDVRQRYVSVPKARADYGVVIQESNGEYTIAGRETRLSREKRR